MTPLERIETLFREINRVGADTDWISYNVDDIALGFATAACAFGYEHALDAMYRASDPRWEPLRLYLQGLVDGERGTDDDASYEEFLAGCAMHCRCCCECWQVPCDGCVAGGICDEVCRCDDDDIYDDDDHHEPFDGRSERWPED